MENDEFIKKIKEYGQIKSVQEAFKEYPVEEEEHKGKLEAYSAVAETTEDYNHEYKIGDIVYVKNFTYEDGSPGKNHLFVIIGEENLAVSIEYFGMLISSKVHKRKYRENKFLPKDDINHLNVDSIIKTDAVYKIEKEEIVLKIGKVDYQRIEEYKESYLKILEMKKRSENV